MYSKQLVALATSVSYASAAIYQGFNYGAEADFATEFALAKTLAGTNGKFASARLYTSISPNTQNTPTAAIQAAIDNGVTLLLGIWGSGGQTTVDNEIAAIKNAIAQYGSKFTSLVAGISVGSEDLYRNSPTGIINMSGIGANPEDIVSYIGQVRKAMTGTALSGAPIGHVDTWTAWVNGSNSAVTSACDFLGVDAYPYFQNTMSNSVDNGYDLFFSAYDQTVAASQGKPVWVTETGWPASGKTENLAVPSTENAEKYWKQVYCKLAGITNTWWYTLNDNGANPSFGVTTGSSTPLYDLSCDAVSSSSSSAAASKTSTSAASVATSSGATTSAVASSASSEVTSSANTATPSNTIISVSSSAVPTQGGGSPGQSSGIQSVSTGTSTTFVVIPTATGGGSGSGSGNVTITSPSVPSPTGNSASSVRFAAGGLVAVVVAILAAL